MGESGFVLDEHIKYYIQNPISINSNVNEALKGGYITDESYSCLVTLDEEWILLRNTNMSKKPIPVLLKTDNLNFNSITSCYLINDRMMDINWRHFKKSSKVFLRDNPTHFGTEPVNNNFQLKVVKFKDGTFLQGRDDIDTYRVFDDL